MSKAIDKRIHADNSDWKHSASPVVRLQSLVFNDYLSDVTFIVGDEKEKINAHKVILASGSPVFDAMFYGSLKNESNLQVIPTIAPKGFRNLLKYLYTEELSEEYEAVVHTLNAAKQYQVPGLEKKCSDIYLQALNDLTVFYILPQALLFNLKDLESKCFDYIELNAFKCLNAGGFLTIELELLKRILKRDGLNMEEYDIYKAVMRWADHQCIDRGLEITTINREGVLENAHRLIRYPVMTNKQFALEPVQDGLLTNEEQLQVFKYINTNPKPAVTFETKIREKIAPSVVFPYGPMIRFAYPPPVWR